MHFSSGVLPCTLSSLRLSRQTTPLTKYENSINSYLSVCHVVWQERQTWHLDNCSPPVVWVTPQEGEEGRGRGQGREGLLAQCSAHRCSSRLSVCEPATWQSPCGLRPVPLTPEHSKMIMLKFTLQQASIQGHNSTMMKKNTHTHTHTTQTHTKTEFSA